MLGSSARRRSQWFYPMVGLAGVALAIACGLYVLDHYLNNRGYGNPFTHYFNFHDDAVSNSIGVLSSIIAAVLGIIITVVSIVVQLAATRYTPAVTAMFFRDRTNLGVFALYIIGCIIGFWTAFGVNADFVPRVSLLVMLCIATLGFVLMAPYFAYVFNFLAPQNIVARLKTEAQGAALTGGKSEEAVHLRQALVVLSMERLSDIAINSISSKDKISATECVDALKELATGYLEGKKQLDPTWFKLGPVTRDNPDFASMTDEAVADLEERRTWIEWKVLRQFQGIYTEALGHMRDIDYVIAISTRQIGEKALDKGIPEALHLVHKFFNTYMRLTINARDVRTAYTILNQFRLLAERILRAGNGQLALKIASHIKYYGHLSHQKKLPFVTETVAYDLGALSEVAHEIKSDVEADLLRNFLDVDRPETEGEEQEASLRGVRKAQVKLATFYLVNKQDDLAQTIWRDMVHEKPERMLSIRDELLKVESKDFWEVTDRGGNFDYLEPARKKMLFKFFGWFAELSGDLRAVSIEPAIAHGRESDAVIPTKNRGAS